MDTTNWSLKGKVTVAVVVKVVYGVASAFVDAVTDTFAQISPVETHGQHLPANASLLVVVLDMSLTTEVMYIVLKL